MRNFSAGFPNSRRLSSENLDMKRLVRRFADQWVAYSITPGRESAGYSPQSSVQCAPHIRNPMPDGENAQASIARQSGHAVQILLSR